MNTNSFRVLFSGFIFIMLISQIVSADTTLEWNKRIHKKDITVWTRNVEGYKVDSYRGQTDFDFPIEAVYQRLINLEGFPDWVQGQKEFESTVADKKFNTFIIGPGNGVGSDTCARVEAILKTGHPTVLDADALTSFQADSKALFKQTHEKCVLTPHIGEFKRLWPKLDPEADKIGTTQAAARQAGCVVLLKGPDTVIATPAGQVIINTHAAPQLATAGAGDVLAGIIGGLLAQGMEPFLAAAAGAWIHGDTSMRLGAGLIAEDLIEQVPDVLADIFGGKTGPTH